MVELSVLLHDLERNREYLDNHRKVEPFNGMPSIYLRTNITTKHEDFNTFSNKITDSILAGISSPNSKRKKIDTDKYYKVVNCILLNLYVNYNLSKELKLRTPSKGNKQYIDIGDDAILKIYNALDNLKYTEITAKGTEIAKRVTRRTATDTLIKDIELTGISFSDVFVEPTRRILFRKSKKKDNYDIEGVKDLDTNISPSKGMTGRLQRINTALSKVNITLCLPDALIDEKFGTDEEYIDPFRKYYHRVFNNSSKREGGRFYGVWWQRIPKEFRSYITINGNKTVELDFKAIQPSILYAQEDHPMKVGKDPYHVDLSKYNLPKPTSDAYKDYIRPAVKEAFNLMINDTEGKMSTGGKYSRMKDEYKEKLSWDDLLTEIKSTHSMISKHFNSGVGIKLQYKDSQIAEQVLLNFAKRGVPCLCMHDSFIVEEQYQTDLQAVMSKAYLDVVGCPSLGIDIKHKDDIRTGHHNMPNCYCLDDIKSPYQKDSYGRYINLNS